MLLARLLDPFIRVGRLTVIDARGGRHVFGSEEAPAVTIRLHDPALHWRLALRPELRAGEAYTDGTLTVEDASLHDFLDLIGRNLGAAGQGAGRGPSSSVPAVDGPPGQPSARPRSAPLTATRAARSRAAVSS